MIFHRLTRHAVSGVVLAGALVGEAQSQATVRTANGIVQGTALASGVALFKGIPFAAPPVGERRWRPPEPVANWQGVRPATRFGPQCMQGRDYDDMVFRNEGTSEDCLYLNVWSPEPSRAGRLPVLVYIYGGGFTGGDGSEPRYDGENIARRGVVVVTMSYRLGVFGFLALPELDQESPHHASGNYGLLDQVAALQWVQRNIAAFGGDPARVAIAGESAGSFSVASLMASPLARGLFAGAIGESGGTGTLAFNGSLIHGAVPRETAEQANVVRTRAMGAPTLAELRALSAFELLAEWGPGPGVKSWPTVDGYFLPDTPDAIFSAGKQARVPLLAGWNSEEGSGRSVVANPTPENFAAALHRVFGTRSAEALAVYPGSTQTEVMISATDFAGDQFTGYGTWKWLEEQSHTDQPVYRYYFSRPRPLGQPQATPSGAGSAPSANPWASRVHGASHSAEIEYALGNLSRNTVYAWTADDQKVSGTMMGYFVNFVKTGNPNGTGLPQWPLGTPDANGKVMRMRIDVDTRPEAEPRARYLFLQNFYSSR